MTRTTTIKALLPLVFVVWGLAGALGEEPSSPYQAAKHEGGELRFVKAIPVLVVQGTPEDMGRQYGALIGETVRPPLAKAGNILRRNGLGIGLPVAAALSRTMIARSPERYGRELNACVVAAGLDQNGRDILAVANSMIELRRVGGCSALLVQDDHTDTDDGPLFGRNLDLPPIEDFERYTFVVVARPEGHNAFAGVGFPGIIGVISGMNEHGLTLATLDSYASTDQSPSFDPTGTPLALTCRQIMEECKTVDEAEALLKQSKRTTWMNLAVCDLETAAVFELTPKTVARREPERGMLACTNHFRTPGLRTVEECSRYATLGKAFGRPSLDIAQVQKMMHAVNQGGATMQSMVFEPRSLKLHLSLGPPPASGNPLTTLELMPLLKPEAAPR